MTAPVSDLPLWVVIAISALLLLGAGLSLLGAIGLLRLPSFYERIHAPTLATSWGVGAIMLASILYFSIVGSRAVLHEILIGIFVTLTTPSPSFCSRVPRFIAIAWRGTSLPHRTVQQTSSLNDRQPRIRADAETVERHTLGP